MTVGYSLVWILGSMFVLILVQRNNVYYYFPSHSQNRAECTRCKHWPQPRSSQVHHEPWMSSMWRRDLRQYSVICFIPIILCLLSWHQFIWWLWLSWSLSLSFMNLSSDCIQPPITLQQNSSLLQRWNISQKLPHIFQTQRLTAPPPSRSHNNKWNESK